LKRIEIKANDNFSLSLNGENLGDILKALQEIPYKKANPIISKINDQINDQLSKKK
jgi:hypothetical protein